jgi:uncharacterized SAM-binding protein YcdF (DUF218 family)
VSFSILKPLLTALVLPPAGPLLLALLGVFLLYRQRKTSGRICLVIGLLSAWTLSCEVTGSWLNRHLLKQYAFISPSDLTSKKPAQAIVVLGSGIQTYAPEYQNVSQPSRLSAIRLRYGAWLALQTHIPLAFSGGKGWASHSAQSTTEAEAADFYLKAFNLPSLKWRDDQSADTAQNASEMARILLPQKVTRIALVTHAWHMERAVQLFTAQGFEVIPAPVHTITPESYDLLAHIPSADGLQDSRHVLREALGLLVLRLAH